VSSQAKRLNRVLIVNLGSLLMMKSGMKREVENTPVQTKTKSTLASLDVHETKPCQKPSILQPGM
jgi:hypothetical protein